jgi:hypothetical protein
LRLLWLREIFNIFFFFFFFWKDDERQSKELDSEENLKKSETTKNVKICLILKRNCRIWENCDLWWSIRHFSIEIFRVSFLASSSFWWIFVICFTTLFHFWKNDFNCRSLINFAISSSRLGWPSGWVEPELGRSTLGLSRVEHRFSARRIESSASVLFARIERIRIIVRRVELNKDFCSSDLNELECMFDDLNRTYSSVRCSNSSLACSS